LKTNIALIGFMGTGKTSVGRALAIRLEKKFVRTDDLIVERAGKTIPEIFEEDGESRFRELEIEIAKEVSEKKDVVIDCGGGIVLNKINVDRLRKNARIILLTASPEVILERISTDGEQRPLLNTPDKPKRIAELLHLREPYYKGSADFEIDTSSLNVDEVIEKIIEFLGKERV